MEKTMKTFQKILCLVLISGCMPYEMVHHKVKVVMNYEQEALNLARENRLLKAEMNKLKSDLEQLKAQNEYLALKNQESESVKRRIASLPDYDQVKVDLVQQKTYQWPAKKLLEIGSLEFDKKSYEKSAQFLYSFVNFFPEDPSINDEVLFKLAVSAYEAKSYDKWTVKYSDMIIQKYPDSSYYRGAKLWRALAYLRQGDRKEFFKTVEEFRLNYRNTTEWPIIRDYYEDIRKKYKD